MAKSPDNSWQTIGKPYFLDRGLKANVFASVTHTPLRDNNFD